jgi:hypothetical protein
MVFIFPKIKIILYLLLMVVFILINDRGSDLQDHDVSTVNELEKTLHHKLSPPSRFWNDEKTHKVFE